MRAGTLIAVQAGDAGAAREELETANPVQSLLPLRGREEIPMNAETKHADSQAIAEDFDPAGTIELPEESTNIFRSSGTTYSKCE